MTGRSTLYIIFDEDVDFYWSRSRIIEKINSLPSGCLRANGKPALGPDATGLGQIFWYYLEGVDDSGEEVGGWDLDERRTLQDYYIKPSLSAVPGVSVVASIGGFVKEFQVDVHPTLLEQYQLSTKDVLNAVEKIAFNEKVSPEDFMLLRAAALFHDSGYIDKYSDKKSPSVN